MKSAEIGNKTGAECLLPAPRTQGEVAKQVTRSKTNTHVQEIWVSTFQRAILLRLQQSTSSEVRNICCLSLRQRWGLSQLLLLQSPAPYCCHPITTHLGSTSWWFGWAPQQPPSFPGEREAGSRGCSYTKGHLSTWAGLALSQEQIGIIWPQSKLWLVMLLSFSPKNGFYPSKPWVSAAASFQNQHRLSPTACERDYMLWLFEITSQI